MHGTTSASVSHHFYAFYGQIGNVSGSTILLVYDMIQL